VSTGETADCYARNENRIEEKRQSQLIIEQCL
jgi:NADH:ubiquinone oxidoreductase subunit D